MTTHPHLMMGCQMVAVGEAVGEEGQKVMIPHCFELFVRNSRC